MAGVFLQELEMLVILIVEYMETEVYHQLVNRKMTQLKENSLIGLAALEANGISMEESNLKSVVVVIIIVILINAMQHPKLTIL